MGLIQDPPGRLSSEVFMEQLRAPALAILPPPVLYAVAFLAGWGLTRLSGWDPDWIRAPGVRWIGVAITIFGLALSLSSAGLFVLRRTTLNPVGQPALFVASGAYAWTRNPMYVGVTLVYLGAALVLGQV